MLEIDYKALGKRIRIARLQNNQTQEELAEAVDISLTHMSNIETGNAKLSLPKLVHIANALSVTMCACEPFGLQVFQSYEIYFQIVIAF